MPLALMAMQLNCESSDQWLAAVLQDFDTFLLDHAANEKKAAGVALNLAAHYPDKPDLIKAMIDLAIEELSHYREVFELVCDRNLTLPADTKDAYVNQLRKLVRNDRDGFFLDRLLIAAVIEARGLERFQKIADALPVGNLKSFYQAIARSESRHANTFLALAQQYHDESLVMERLAELIAKEAEILQALPPQAALH